MSDHPTTTEPWERLPGERRDETLRCPVPDQRWVGAVSLGLHAYTQGPPERQWWDVAGDAQAKPT